MATIVVADQVTKDWGATRALAGVSFAVGKGVTGLLGANGAGKTTLLGLLLGLHPVDGGGLSVLGLDPWVDGARVRAVVGYAPEHDALPPDVRAHDLVRHLAELHGLPGREAQARASDALYEVGLGEERFRAVGTMSTGQRQRVKLATAIAHDPNLVLLDEPTSGLDPVQREQMLALVRRVGHRLGLDVVLSSHLLEEVERVADAAVILDAGRVVRAGNLGDLRRSERDELLVELDAAGGAQRLAATLADRGCHARAESDHLVVVELASPDTYEAVRDAIAELGLGLRRMQARTATLEEVFLAGAVPR